jgi:hypothetical protein
MQFLHELRAKKPAEKPPAIHRNPSYGLTPLHTRKLLDNAKVVRFLNGNYRDMLSEFESLAAAQGV